MHDLTLLRIDNALRDTERATRATLDSGTWLNKVTADDPGVEVGQLRELRDQLWVLSDKVRTISLVLADLHATVRTDVPELVGAQG